MTIDLMLLSISSILDIDVLTITVHVHDRRVAVRTFSSAAILKRHTATILETIDGIIVTVCGLLDISRTSQNGFPPEVCNTLRTLL